VVNYGPIAPEESRLIFAREALVYRRLHRRPDWLRANDAAIEAAQRMEERLRTRDLLHPPERFVEFYNGVLPRQVSSGTGLEYFTRNLPEGQRAALTLKPDAIFARSPDPQRLARFPEQVALGDQDASGARGATRSAADALGGSRLWVPVEYRFAPGEAGDGATLRVPLLALPLLTRAMVDAAVPGLAEPRVEALLRSLPKEARRNLIPMGATVTAFMEFMGAPSTNMQRLAAWLKEHRGIPESLIRFDVTAIPAHLTAQLAVVAGGKELVQGSDLSLLRRRFAAQARAELERLARTAHPAPWRRFEADALPESVAVQPEQGALREDVLRLYPTLVRRAHAVEVRYEWTAEEAAQQFRQGSVFLARLMLDRQARDMTKKIGADTQFMLAASPYLHGDELVDILLQLTFRRACFEEAEAPRTRAAFETAVDRGRERLYPVLDEVVEGARHWFSEARSVRRLLDDMRARPHADRVEEAQGHLRHLLSSAGILGLSGDWLRQLPRYIKAEERRWQRLFARGSEPPPVLRELTEWSARAQCLENRVSAETRWLPQLEEFRAWIEEYRVSLYAQELRTLGPVSAARLAARAAEIEAWLSR
jgi:ATP-dependent helicase HrpA